MQLIIFIIFLISSYSSPELWIVEKNSTITVKGESNINSFSCQVPSYMHTDTMLFKTQTADGSTLVESSLRIPVEFFDCQNRHMTKDLQKTLHIDQHPYLYIKFNSFSTHPNNWKNGSKVSAKAFITISGVTKQYTVLYQIHKNQENKITLSGNQKVLFSDFKLKPPSKLGGTIRVKDELTVHITLVLSKY
ncbi:MAG: YceI family protein [Saprospiraceae bacterium]